MDVPRVVPPPQRKDSSSPGQKQHSFDEAKKVNHVNILLKIFGLDKTYNIYENVTLSNLPKKLLRTSKYLTHPVFLNVIQDQNQFYLLFLQVPLIHAGIYT